MLKLAKVYIIILNYNGWKDTIECLTSVLNLADVNYQVLVVDNKSTNNSFDKLTTWAKYYFQDTPNSFTILTESDVLCGDRRKASNELTSRIIFIQSDANLGFAAGNNIALKYALDKADYEYLWLLNNDTIVDPMSLSELIMKASQDHDCGKKIGIWGSKLLFYHSPTTIQAVGGKYNSTTFTTKHVGENLTDSPSIDKAVFEVDYVVGASMFVSKCFVTEIGLLDENYFLYFEELDWATRGRQKGFQLGYAPTSVVFHKEGQSIGSSSDGAKKSALADFHGVRSKIRYVTKFYPRKLPILYLLLIVSILLRLSRLQFKRAKSILLLILQKGL